MSNIIIDPNNFNDLLWPLYEKACGHVHGQAVLLDALHDELLILSPPERAAYLLGNLIGQVRNGGWEQWVTNEYGVQLRQTREVAAAMQTKLSRRIVRMLDALEPLLDWDTEGGEQGRHDFVMTPAQQEDRDWDRPVVTAGEKLCEKLDDRFDAIDQEWETEINTWLRQGAPGLTG